MKSELQILRILATLGVSTLLVVNQTLLLKGFGEQSFFKSYVLIVTLFSAALFVWSLRLRQATKELPTSHSSKS